MISHQPQSRNQSTLAMAEPAPASARRTAVRPNGQTTMLVMRKAATPRGMPMIVMHMISPASA